MKYNVFIQNSLNCTIEAEDTDDVLRVVANKISEGHIVLDPTKPKGIRIEPVNE
jgi:hypothetical protein